MTLKLQRAQGHDKDGAQAHLRRLPRPKEDITAHNLGTVMGLFLLLLRAKRLVLVWLTYKHGSFLLLWMPSSLTRYEWIFAYHCLGDCLSPYKDFCSLHTLFEFEEWTCTCLRSNLHFRKQSQRPFVLVRSNDDYPGQEWSLWMWG